MAGFAVGIVDKDKIIDGSRVMAGDVLIGIASSGIHSNGYSLVRKLININDENGPLKLNEVINTLGCKMGEEILKPTKIYVKPILEIIDKYNIKAISHITGGGFYENIPRMLPSNLKAIINKGSWEVLPIFKILQEMGNLSEKDMYNTFNMGIGMVIAVSPEESEDVIKLLNNLGEKAYEIGKISEGENGVELC
jgi:phosphoribosylformylglycinamidine cyclo-ligase